MAWSKGLDVEAGGHGGVSHIGSAATRLLADRAGLTGALSRALARRGFSPLYDRGRVLTDLAVAIADGATTIGEIGTLRHQGELFGPVASDTTAWRALAGCDGAALARISTATNTPRGQIQFPGARHRTQARAEDKIRCAKSTGLGHLPSADYQVNTAWCQAASIACDLLAWLRLLALDGDLAKAEPKTLRPVNRTSGVGSPVLGTGS